MDQNSPENNTNSQLSTAMSNVSETLPPAAASPIPTETPAVPTQTEQPKSQGFFGKIGQTVENLLHPSKTPVDMSETFTARGIPVAETPAPTATPTEIPAATPAPTGTQSNS